MCVATDLLNGRQPVGLSGGDKLRDVLFDFRTQAVSLVQQIEGQQKTIGDLIEYLGQKDIEIAELRNENNELKIKLARFVGMKLEG